MQDYHAEFVEIYNKNITRPGADRLLNWLETTDFFTAPASTRFHGACECGLVMHSINVYNAMMQHFYTEGENAESYAICGLLHDLCKANFYKVSTRNVKNDATGQWEKVPFYQVADQLPYGHGEKSVYLIEHFMRLKTAEAIAIRWHMGGFDDAARGIVKAAHVPADGNSLGGFQPHKMLDEVDTLLAVAVGQLIRHLVKRDLLPLAGGVVFDIAGADLIEVCLAQVVQQAADGITLGVLALGVEVLHHCVVHVDAVHDQAALARAVEPGGGRRGEKVGGFQPVQQPVRTGAGDVFVVDLHKFSVVVLHTNLTVPCRPECPSAFSAHPRSG